ncbi:unnamed protein product [Parnassius mnemosyne]|uniref:Transmembrane protein 126A n=1 Tax=Parnassius mnemosyne TaxID=213953 RepID=A0AAV1M162_9NEOP
MALMKSDQVPEDAVALSEIEATTYMWDLVNNWESLSETWALRYTPAILGAINGCSGVLLNSYYRRKLKLGKYGYFSSVIPISLMPGVLTALFHRHLVSTDMLLMKNESCPICYELRSGLIQIALGCFYPMVLGPTSALMFANRYSTYRVPDLADGPKVVLKFLRTQTKPFTGTLTSMVAIQLAASSILTYFEMKNNISLRQKITEIEKKVLNE